MNTGKELRAWVVASGIAMAFFLMGCGGGGGNSEVAPSALSTKSFTLNETGDGTSKVTFTTPSDYAFQHPSGAVESGTYTSSRSGNIWTVSLVSTLGGQQIYTLTFASAASGTYTLHRDGEADRSGVFAASNDSVSAGDVTPPPASGGTDSGGSTSGGSTSGGGTSGSAGYTGFAPEAIAGRTMFGTRTFTSTGTSGQTHTYTFTAGTFHDSDAPEESGGTYTYAASNSHATLDLKYTTPSTFVGDHHTLNMTFTAKDQGTFESSYTRGDGTTITINGTFEFQALP